MTIYGPSFTFGFPLHLEEMHLGTSLDTDQTAALSALATLLHETSGEDSLCTPANIPGASPDGCQPRRKPTELDRNHAPFATNKFLRGIFGFAFRLKLHEKDDKTLLAILKEFNAWATRHGQALLPWLVPYLIGRACGICPNQRQNRRNQEAAGLHVSRSMSEEQLAKVQDYAKTGWQQMSLKLQYIPPNPDCPFKLRKFASSP